MQNEENKLKLYEFRKSVWLRDNNIFIESGHLKKWQDFKKCCRFWKCLTDEERVIFLDNTKEMRWLLQTIDVAHRIPKSISLEEKYNPNNGFLINRIAHSSSQYGLDNYKNPLTGKDILYEEKDYWFKRIAGEI